MFQPRTFTHVTKPITHYLHSCGIQVIFLPGQHTNTCQKQGYGWDQQVMNHQAPQEFRIHPQCQEVRPKMETMLHVFRSSVGYTRPISQPSSGDERGDTNSGRVAVVPSYCHHQTCSDLLFYRFYKTLFSALKQTHCAHITPDSE